MSLSVLIAVTHLLGVGHLTRAAALGRGLAAAGHRVTLVTGGRAAPLVATTGMTVVQLPAVHCRGVAFTKLLDDDGEPAGPALLQARIAALPAALEGADPDVIVTETFPFGRRVLAAEFMALIEAAEQRAKPPAVLASIRDILNPPSRPSRAAEAHERLARHFHGVLVHGDAAVTPLDASWPTERGLERQLVYTGYVNEAASSEPTLSRSEASDEVLVSGGGSAASLPLFEAALGAAERLDGRPWRLLVGHGVPAPAFERLVAHACNNAVVERARPDFPALLARAAVSVSQAGYNTMIDLARARARAVLVPFEQGNEAEQRLRAERFAASGAATIVPEAELTPATLAAAVAAALARPRPQAGTLDLDGVAASGRAIAAGEQRHRARLAQWSRLEAALAQLRAGGRALDVWWRDDDAVAPGEALDRLLALARRFGAPLALAVIPAEAEPALAERLHGEPSVRVLVHGWQHRSHAPAGAKKQELGYRAPATIEAELRQGRARIEALFGPQAVLVLVPPWNRIDPAIVPLLPGLGFRALSTFGPRPVAPGGIAVVNTHLDPIAWKEGGGLAEEVALVAAAADHVERAIAGADEPFGLLTHHRVHDAWIWAFVERLLQRLGASGAVRFRSIEHVMKP